MSFVGGKLKLKGGVDVTQLKGGIKKKKKKSTGSELAVVPAAADGGEGQAAGGDAAAAGGSAAAAAAAGGSATEPAIVKVTREGAVLDSSAQADRRTDAERKAEAHFLRYEEQRARKLASKSHRERIKELNEKLANETEHHDIFRISYTA